MPSEPKEERPWRIVRSESGPDLRIFSSRFEWIENPRNRKVLQAVILEARDWVNVVALTPEKKIIAVSQFRFGIRRQSLEIPAGLVDQGETPLQAAQRELGEETGYTASHWKFLGWSYTNPAFLNIDPAIGEPTTATFVTRSGYSIATDKLTVPPILWPTSGACAMPNWSMN